MVCSFIGALVRRSAPPSSSACSLTMHRAQSVPVSDGCSWMLSMASVALAAGLVAPASSAIVVTLETGEGANLSTIQVDFSNGNGYLLEYRWDGSATGFSALEALDQALPEFTLVAEPSPFGPLVSGLGVLGDYEYGTGDLWPAVENYWHYWLKDSGQWSWAPLGAADRQLFDGSFDAWVFGSSVDPQPVPAPSAMLLLTALAPFCRRRRASRP